MIICAHVKQDVVFRMSTKGSPSTKDGELGTRSDEASVEIPVAAQRGPKGKRMFGFRWLVANDWLITNHITNVTRQTSACVLHAAFGRTPAALRMSGMQGEVSLCSPSTQAQGLTMLILIPFGSTPMFWQDGGF